MIKKHPYPWYQLIGLPHKKRLNDLLLQCMWEQRRGHLKQFEPLVKVVYYPLCSGEGNLPNVYEELTRPRIREITVALDMMTKLSHFQLLPYIYTSELLSEKINGLNIRHDEKEDLFRYTKVYRLILEILSDVIGILSAFGETVSIEEVQAKMSTMYTGFWNPNKWWSTITNLGNVFGVEEDQMKWAKRSRSGRTPNLVECGVHVATLNEYTIGSIWTFSDPRMVSNDGAIRYIFVQGIRSSVPYIIARMLRPDIVPPVSKVLIKAVEEWAHQQGANAIRINPIGSMIKILIQYHGFQHIAPEVESQLSPFLQEELQQHAANKVIKYL